ncbi:MAG: metal-binding protein [Rhodocyclales bacterium]|nr:metal-binding protein [Rhodocyclales bacterium]
MSHHNASIADRVIADPFEFARRGAVLEAEAVAGGFDRLADQLRPAGAQHAVKYRVEGECHEDKEFLVLQVTADVVLGCQRCLGDVTCPVESHVRLLLVREGDELPDEDLAEDDFDPVHANRNLDVLALVEDELLLSLPLSPMHEDCSMLHGEGRDNLVSPFAVLGKLKRPD